METPSEKKNYQNNFTNQLFSNKINLFTSTEKTNDLFFIKDFNSYSPFNYSFNKFFVTSYKRPNPRNASTQQQSKNQLSSCKVKLAKENYKEIHKINVKKSSFKISNVNFNIKLSYMK